MNQKIEAYMMVGFHTLVTMERSVVGYRIATCRVTPQDDGMNIAAMLSSTWTEFVRCQYATTEVEALLAFSNVVAREISEEREAQISLAA